MITQTLTQTEEKHYFAFRGKIAASTVYTVYTVYSIVHLYSIVHFLTLPISHKSFLTF